MSILRIFFFSNLIFKSQGLHPRVITDGLNEAKKKALEVLEKMKIPVEGDREKLLAIARTSLRTKVHHKIATLLTEV